ncbi:MAG: hypothetical protein U0T73_05750 [Chitinophagales bacterium]
MRYLLFFFLMAVTAGAHSQQQQRPSLMIELRNTNALLMASDFMKTELLLDKEQAQRTYDLLLMHHRRAMNTVGKPMTPEIEKVIADLDNSLDNNLQMGWRSEQIKKYEQVRPVLLQKLKELNAQK